MRAEDLRERIRAEYGDRVEGGAHSPKRLYVAVPPDLLEEFAAWLAGAVPALRFSTSTGIDLREGIGVFHHFVVNGAPLVVTVKVVARRPDPEVPTLTSVFPAAAWIEREVAEMLGVKFVGHPDPQRLLMARTHPAGTHPLRRDFDVGAFKEEIHEMPEY